MTTKRIELPPKLIPVFTGNALYRGAYGGRGSAKTRSFAKMAAVFGLKFAQANQAGVIVCSLIAGWWGRRWSLEEVKAAIESEPWLAAAYDVGDKFVRTKDRKIEFAFIGLRHNLDSIKSKSRIRLLWVDEAEPVSETAWSKAIPTVREDGSEVWVTWNPERRKSSTHKRFRLEPPSESKIVEINWKDNPWFPDRLNKTRLDDQAKRPDQYEHVWEGDFVSIVDGAYYASSLAEAKAKGRIGNVSADPLMQIKAFWDIGGTGLRADATAIWIAQFIGREIRILDYYEAVGQPLAAHVQWLRDSKYEKALCVLPHDGAAGEKVMAMTYQSALEDVGFETSVIPNQGRGAAKMRVEAARRLFPSMWFNATTTEPGREALGWYHEKKSDDEREIGLGPEHDWSSHGADAFGLMAIAYEQPTEANRPSKLYVGQRAGSWMGQ